MLPLWIISSTKWERHGLLINDCLVNELNRGQSKNIDVYTSLLAKVSRDLIVNDCRVKRSFIDISSNILPHVATLGDIGPNEDDDWRIFKWYTFSLFTLEIPLWNGKLQTFKTISKFLTRYRPYSKMHLERVHCINGRLNLWCSNVCPHWRHRGPTDPLANSYNARNNRFILLQLENDSFKLTQ